MLVSFFLFDVLERFSQVGWASYQMSKSERNPRGGGGHGSITAKEEGRHARLCGFD